MFLKEETHFLRTNLIPPEEIDNFQNPHANAAYPSWLYPRFLNYLSREAMEFFCQISVIEICYV